MNTTEFCGACGTYVPNQAMKTSTMCRACYKTGSFPVYTANMAPTPSEAPLADPEKFGCPSCGDTQSLGEINKSTNVSLIGYIRADTGEIVWEGETEYGDPEEHITYCCRGCEHEFDRSAFNPKERIAEAMAGLAALDEYLEDD